MKTYIGEVYITCEEDIVCDCGGIMNVDQSFVLLSDPPKRKLICPFCGHEDYKVLNNNVNIQFKVKGETK